MRPDSDLVRECFAENRARLMAVVDAVQIATRNVDPTKKETGDEHVSRR